MSRSSDELLQIAVDGSETASLDIIKLEDGSTLFVVSERGPVQRRTVVKVSPSDGIRIAKFMVGIPGNEGGNSEGEPD
jgi:hypothetical protein